MEDTANIVVYHNDEIIRNTYEGVQHPRIELYVEFEHIVADEVQHDTDVQDDTVEAYLRMNNDSDGEFEATYEADDEDEDDDREVLIILRMGSLESKWNTIQENQSLRQFRVTLSPEESITLFMNLSHRRSIQSARLMDVGATGLIQKKACWKIRRYNGRHMCSMETILQDHSKLDSDTIAEAIKPLVEFDPSIKVKSIIVVVQTRFNYTISYQKAWLAK
ncbi:hypothetical protein Ahy_B06g080550 [Arachis hypogaea]|uniref:Transposase MuDR plant domain-containing protein n=1 Tax=Arachis hypogaea TaxID=3818 RepID=A0A444YIG5_ARAHY|nr:hypothetical protein Ahy_B06g080550 [Arachis hypogaea]